MLILHVPDTLQHTSPDGIAQIFGSGLGVDVPEIDRPVQGLVPIHAAKAVHAAHASKIRSERQIGGHGRPEVALTMHGREGSLGNERLGCGSLSGLSGGLLRLGDVSASILAIVDTLPCPGGLRRECIDDLRSQKCEYHMPAEW